MLPTMGGQTALNLAKNLAEVRAQTLRASMFVASRVRWTNAARCREPATRGEPAIAVLCVETRSKRKSNWRWHVVEPVRSGD